MEPDSHRQPLSFPDWGGTWEARPLCGDQKECFKQAIIHYLRAGERWEESRKGQAIDGAIRDLVVKSDKAKY
jgi:hypothetical protein